MKKHTKGSPLCLDCTMHDSCCCFSRDKLVPVMIHAILTGTSHTRCQALPAKLFIGEKLDSRIWYDADTIGPIPFHHAPHSFLFCHEFETLQMVTNM